MVSFNALHWIPEQDIALRAIRSAMKPDATAQLRLVPKGERKSLEDVLEETRKSGKWSSYYDGYRDPYLHLTPEEYSTLAEQNGPQLGKTKYLAGDAFSYGDIPVGIMIYRYVQLIPERPATANLDRWYAAISSRPAFKEQAAVVPLT